MSERRAWFADRRSPRDAAARLLVGGFMGGLAMGFALWGAQQRSHRRDLFSGRSLDRLAALGYLRGRPSAETARVLREYLRWEQAPGLRRHARGVLRRMESRLD